MTRVIGPPRSRRRRWWYAGITLVAAALFGVLYVAGASAIISGPPIASPSSFESNDGNMVLDTSGHTDWSCFVNSDGFAHNATTPSGCAVTSGAKNVAADAAGEISWVNGQKFDTQCPALAVNNNPPKDEFTDVASYSETASNLNVFFYGASIRSTANGNASGDVEFNQVAGNGTTSAGCRTFGDRLVAYDFLNGGTGLDLHVLTWIDNSVPGTSDVAGGNSGTCFVKTDSMPCWGAAVIHPSNADTSVLEGQSNQSTITAANNPLNNTALAVNQFAEFGVNLSNVIGTGSGCISFPQEVWESRSSGSSFTSNPQDIEIENQQVANCGRVIIHKQTSPRGQNQVFGFNSTIPNPTGTVTTSSSPYCQGDTLPNGTYTGSGDGGFALNDSGNSTTNNAANTEDCKNLVQGSYTVTEQTNSSYTLSNIVCTLSSGATSSVTYGAAAHSSFVAGDTVVNITLKPTDTVECTYTNTLNQGALLIKKESTKTGNPLVQVAGATFCYRTTTGCTSVTGTNVTDTTDSTGGDSDTTIGEICVSGLTPGNYFINETGAPTGYGIGTSGEQTATVVSGTNCSSNKPSSSATGLAVFTDPPLSKIQVIFSRVGTQTETSASIVCTDASSNVISAVSENGNADPAFDDTNETFGNGTSTLVPGTYTCTVVIDP